jgi:ribosomal protein S18 acetylase RimI-like enzyme
MTGLPIQIEPMRIEDYDEILSLWQGSPGMEVTSSDAPGPIAGFIERNPGLSLVARSDGRIVGALLAGHDGRRGYLHHLAVDTSQRRQGIGGLLVRDCLKRLAELGIDKCHAMVFRDNQGGMAFWTAAGWQVRSDLNLVSRFIDPE